MKVYIKMFLWGFGLMVLLNVIYSANARGIVNVTACLSTGVAGGIIAMIGYSQYRKFSNTGKKDDAPKGDKKET